MEQWLRESLETEADLQLLVVATRLTLALALGLAVAAIHYLTARSARDERLSLSATLVLLSILIAMVTQVIGDSIARAFSLVGALAIVRFRTVVEDTRDTAFVIFAVIVGMATGADHLQVALVGLGVVGFAAFLMKGLAQPSVATFLGKWLGLTALRKRLGLATPVVTPGPDFSLTLRVGLGQGQESLFESTFTTYLENATLQSTSTARQGAALELTWLVRLRPDVSPLALLGELNQLEGVQGVELKRR